MDYERHYEQYRAAVEDYLSALFAGSAPYDRLYDAMRYSVLSGGKRIRPVLTLEFARLGGIDWQVGEKTTDTAAFLLADTSGGLRFTTQVSREDAVYVDSGDTVALKAGDRTWEDMTVLSTETEEDHTVKVTVYVPKKTIPLGANASMELCKTSEEYSVTLPITAIHSEKDKYFVYTMEKADTVLGGAYVAKKTNVTIAEKNGEYAAMKEGDLSSEDAVIVDSDAVLSAGENVRLQES